ncbi:MAG: hypothetical protein WEA04_01925 [Candidatus Andersenbacteria bacterium]
MPFATLQHQSAEQQTLIFSNPEEALAFTHELRKRIHRAPRGSTHSLRDIVAQAVAEQFAQWGEAVDRVREPWQHNRAEHQEAQRLVEVAFAHDLPTALRRARQSSHYPRNLDLFHDALTAELYRILQPHHPNRQPLGSWRLTASMCMAAATLLIVLLFIAA